MSTDIGRLELFAMAALVAATMVKSVAAHGPALHLVAGAAYLGALFWAVRMPYPAGRTSWVPLAATTLLGIWSMVESHNETLLMTMCLLPVSALWFGMLATTMVAGLLVVTTLLVCLLYRDTASDMVQWVASVVGGVCFLLAFSHQLLRAREQAVALRKQAQLDQALTVAAERERFAADLHDGLGHVLSAALVQLEAARATARTDTTGSARFLEQSRDLIQQAFAELKRTVATERPSGAGRPLRSALDDLAAASEAAGVRVEQIGWDALDHLQPGSLTPETAYALLRAVQEGLTNVRRHAQASRAQIRISTEPDSIVVELTDNGLGCRDLKEGNGLGIMRERLARVGGSVEFGTGLSGGFFVRIQVPK